MRHFLAKGYITASVLLVASLAIQGCSSLGQDQDVNRTLLHMVTKVGAEPTSSFRERRADELLKFAFGIKGKALDTVDDRSIDAIVNLLQDSDEYVRWNAAVSLGHLGIRARRALPALKRALSEAMPVPRKSPVGESKDLQIVIRTGGPDLAGTIETAIYMIDR